MPSPRKNEGEKDFISRCMSSKKSKNSFPDSKQRTAFCYSQWKNKSKATRMEELLESLKMTLGAKKNTDG